MVLLLSLTAMAELGGSVASVRADQQRLNGTRTVKQTQAYAIHEIRTVNNGVIHEFVSPEGKVFAVTYQGRFPGESNGLLGTYATQLAEASKLAQGQKQVGGSVHLQLPGLTYHAMGHMRYFSMTAYVPEGVPKGVALEEIR